MITIMESQSMDLRVCQLSFVNIVLPSLEGNAEAEPRFGGTKGLKSNGLGIDTWPTIHCSVKNYISKIRCEMDLLGPSFCDLGVEDKKWLVLHNKYSNLISFIGSPKQQNPRSCKSNWEITKLRYVCNTTDLMHTAVSSITFYHHFHFQYITLKTLSSSKPAPNAPPVFSPVFFWIVSLFF